VQAYGNSDMTLPLILVPINTLPVKSFGVPSLKVVLICRFWRLLRVDQAGVAVKFAGRCSGVRSLWVLAV
jgi:hypothetical protein